MKGSHRRPLWGMTGKTMPTGYWPIRAETRPSLPPGTIELGVTLIYSIADRMKGTEPARGKHGRDS